MQCRAVRTATPCNNTIALSCIPYTQQDHAAANLQPMPLTAIRQYSWAMAVRADGREQYDIPDIQAAMADARTTPVSLCYPDVDMLLRRHRYYRTTTGASATCFAKLPTDEPGMRSQQCQAQADVRGQYRAING